MSATRSRTSVLRATVALALVASGCTPAPIATGPSPAPAGRPSAPEAPGAPAPAREHGADASPTRAVAALPAGFALDGRVGEWSLAEAGGHPLGSAAVLHPGGLTVAGCLAARGPRRMFVGVAFPVPDVPMVGSLARGGGVEPPRCDRDWRTGEPLTPEAKHRCEAPLRAREEFAARYALRFRRVFAIGERLAEVVPGGEEPLEGGVVRWSTQGDRACVEATILPRDLPETAQAPVSRASVLVSAEAIARWPDPERGVALSPAPPIHFEPHGELREALLRHSTWTIPFVASYTPGDDLVVQVAGHAPGGSVELTMRRQELLTPLTTVGDVRVARVHTGWPYRIAILRGDTLLDTVDLWGNPGEFAPVVRGGGVHVLTRGTYETEVGSMVSRVEVLEIRPDGTHEIVSDPESDRGGYTGWLRAESTIEPGFERFSLTGLAESEANRAQHVPRRLTWRWDARAGRYVRTPKVKEPAR